MPHWSEFSKKDKSRKRDKISYIYRYLDMSSTEFLQISISAQFTAPISANIPFLCSCDDKAQYFGIFLFQSHGQMVLKSISDGHTQASTTSTRWCKAFVCFQLNFLSWASYQICKIAGCACVGNAGNVFPATAFKGNHGLAIPACITARAWPQMSWCMPGCWSMRNPQFYISGKRPMASTISDRVRGLCVKR